MDESEQRVALEQLYGESPDDDAPQYNDDSEEDQLYNNAQSGLQQAASQAGNEDESDVGMGSYGLPTVRPADIHRADAHLQGVINDLIQRQQAMNVKMSPDAGPSRAAMAALASGFGGGSYFGSGAGRGLVAAAPYLQKQDLMYQAGTQGLENLRLRAAEIERQRLHDTMQAQAMGTYRQARRQDHLASMGLTINEHGDYVVDPNVIKAQAERARAIAEARRGGAGAGGSPNLTDDELKQFNLPEGTSAVWDKNGNPKILHYPTKDEQGLLTPATRSRITSKLEAARDVLPHLNWMINDLENNKTTQSAFGMPGGLERLYNATLGQATGNIAPNDTAFRDSLGMVNEKMKHALSRDPTRSGLSTAEAKDIEQYLPQLGWFESKDSALTSMKAAREQLLDAAKANADLMGKKSPYKAEDVDGWATKIQKSDSLIPKPVFHGKGATGANANRGGPAIDQQYPVQLKKGDKAVTVTNKDEFNDATSEGWK